MQEQPVLLEEDGFEDEILVEEETTVVNAMWGDIGGNIENQTDLQNALDSKQDSLTETQLSAVNSGITAEKVTTYDGYADQIASKANQSALNAEATTREQADTALGRRIDDEATARQQADNGLQSQIDAITSQSDVVDVVANYAALQAYDTSSLSDNDVIKVLDDETHEDALTYYRWSTTTQTWTYIGQEAPYYSKGQMDVKLAEKQDKLTAGANIQIENGTISATDTTYTAGNGLNLNGTEFSADTDILATKEDLENYYTKPETDNLLAPKLEAEVVAELPTTGEEGKLYLTPKAHTTQTATGNPITAIVAEDAGALESFQLDGDTFQQSYEGKNLFEAVPYSNPTQQGITTTITNTNIIHLEGTSNTTYANLTNLFATSLPAGTYTLSINKELPFRIDLRTSLAGGSSPDRSIQAGETSVTFTTGDTITGMRIFIATGGAGVDFNETFTVQLVSGSTPDYDFEPYTGGTPSPNPDYPQPIQTVTGLQTVDVQGKNLNRFPYASGSSITHRGVTFTANPDGSVTIKGTHDGGGTAIYYFRNFWTYNETNGVVLDANITITASITGGAEYGIRFIAEGYHSDGTYDQLNTTSSQTITTTAKATFNGRITVYAGFSSTEGITVYPMIETGSTATAYAPYQATSYPLDLGSIELYKLGTYQDYIWKDGEDWKIHKATVVQTYDGSSDENWGTTGTNVFAVPGNGVPNLGAPQLGINASFIFNPVQTSVSGTLADGEFALQQNAGTNGRLFFKTTKASTVEDFISWLTSNNQKIYYGSATPTDTVITDTTLIAQLEAIRTASLENGANTITNTATGSNLAGDMEIGYYGFAPRNRYDKWLWLDINNEYEQIGS